MDVFKLYLFRYMISTSKGMTTDNLGIRNSRFGLLYVLQHVRLQRTLKRRKTVRPGMVLLRHVLHVVGAPVVGGVVDLDGADVEGHRRRLAAVATESAAAAALHGRRVEGVAAAEAETALSPPPPLPPSAR